MVLAESQFFFSFVLLKSMCHLFNTIFLLILAIISSADSSDTFCVVIGLVLSFVMHRSYLFSLLVIGTWLELQAETM
jgi:hypothetical protein